MDDSTENSEEEGFGLVDNRRFPVASDVVVIHHGRAAKWALGILILAALAIFLPSSAVLLEEFEEEMYERATDWKCPVTAEKVTRDDVSHFNFEGPAAEVGQNIHEFLEKIQTEEFDARTTMTYNQIKEGMFYWKKSRFAPNLKSGDTIYESACGIGLNLYCTVEILSSLSINNITVYGNDHHAKSAEAANVLWDHFASTVNAQKGKICNADSTHLEFIPDHSFDLVFTGYITPLSDPLNLQLGSEETYQRLSELCGMEDWQSQTLDRLANERQEDWYAGWVSELIRIAKPGKPVIIEQVSNPYCDVQLDLGGVRKEFWGRAIETYKWDVDPFSLDIEDDTLHVKRYNVFLRKNKY